MNFICESCHLEYSTKEFNRTDCYESMCNTCFDEYNYYNDRLYNSFINQDYEACDKLINLGASRNILMQYIKEIDGANLTVVQNRIINELL